MSRRTDAYAALKDLVEQAVRQFATLMVWDETPDVKELPANEPMAIPEQSLVVIRDLGTRTVPTEFGRGPNRDVKECVSRAQVEVYTRDQPNMDRNTAVDGLKVYIGEALEIDATFAGAVEDSDIEEAQLDGFGEEGHDTVAGAAIIVSMTWYSERALG